VVEDLRGKNEDGSASRHWVSTALLKGATMGDCYLASQLVVRDGCRPHVCLTFDATHVVEADAHMLQVQLMFERDILDNRGDIEMHDDDPERWDIGEIMRYPLVSARRQHVSTRQSS
jgi:hypothetical protein